MYRNPKVKASPWGSIMPRTATGSYLSLLSVGSLALYEVTIVRWYDVGLDCVSGSLGISVVDLYIALAGRVISHAEI
jgi:hypothetical protein